MPPPPSASRRFLSWSRPLLPQAVEYLARGWSGEEALDLSTLLVLVPTRQAGRRLREALAAFAASRGQAVFSPRVLTLEALVTEVSSAAEDATRLEVQLAWVRVLREVEMAAFRAVFPMDPPERNFAWAQRLAVEFARLQDVLAEIGLRFADVTARAGAEFPEQERWRQLAALEQLQAAALAQCGRHDATGARLGRLRDAALPSGVARIVMVATPDPRPVALALLAHYAAQVPVEVLVYAPESEAEAFDCWGRPVPEVWATRELLADNFEQRVTVCADPAAQSERLAEAAEAYTGAEDLCALGVVDEEIIPALAGALQQRGIAAYNPEGATRRGDRLHQLLGALANFAREDSFAAVAALARQPDVLLALRTKLGAGFSAAHFLDELDRVHARHLPADLTAARGHEESAGLDCLAGWRERLGQGAFPANAAAVLSEIFAGRRFALAKPEEADLAAAAEIWSGVLDEIGRGMGVCPGLTREEAWEIALRLYGEAREFPDKPAGAIELQGWLELVWEDAPHLVIAGFNEGRVPSAVTGDPFLPESLRVRLGLKTNAMRYATDAYYLRALGASREEEGRFEVVLGRTSAGGEPLRPSRLLLRCRDAELPPRVAYLFRELPATAANLAWSRAWRLRPPEVRAPDRLAVTALRAWLDCPFRFYLARVLKMEAVDVAKVEMDAMDFGILCHDALEAMAKEPALCDCMDAATLRGFLLESLDRAVARRFGGEPALPLLVQLESARQRLAAAAEVQALLRAEGWVIERSEWKFELSVGALTVAGKIDRIDRHAVTGAVRVIDYKTSDKPVRPDEAHLRAVRAGENRPEWALWRDSEGGRERTWKDLQLPLYERVAAALFPGVEVTCGYFNLPKAATETALELWQNYPAELAESAWACAEGVAAAVARGDFWPPREVSGREADYDDFATLFHRGAEDSIVWLGEEEGGRG